MTERLTVAIVDDRLYGLAETVVKRQHECNAWELINRCEACKEVARPDFLEDESNKTSKLLSDPRFVSTLLLESELHEFREQMEKAAPRNVNRSLELLEKVDPEGIVQLADAICDLHSHFLATAPPYDSAVASEQQEQLLRSLERAIHTEETYRSNTTMTQYITGIILGYRTAIITHDIGMQHPKSVTSTDTIKILQEIAQSTSEEDVQNWPHAHWLLCCIHDEARYFADEFARRAGERSLGVTACRGNYTEAC